MTRAAWRRLGSVPTGHILSDAASNRFFYAVVDTCRWKLDEGEQQFCSTYRLFVSPAGSAVRDRCRDPNRVSVLGNRRRCVRKARLADGEHRYHRSYASHRLDRREPASSAFLQSTNGGSTFTKRGHVPGTMYSSLSFVPPLIVLAAASDQDKVYRSVNGGVSWTTVTLSSG